MASVIGRFDHAAELIAATRAATARGFRHMEAYAPFPVPGLEEALGFHERLIPPIALVAGILAAIAAFGMQWYAGVYAYPFVVGGKPLFSWPAFMLVTTAMCILAAVLAAFLAMLAGNRLPQPWHPAFDWPEFDRASGDGFFLLIADGDAEAARTFLNEHARETRELPP